MKKFLTIILFFATVLVFGQEVFPKPESLQNYFLEIKDDIDLTQGIDMEKIIGKDPLVFNNFNNYKALGSYSFYQPIISSDNNFIAGDFENYYKLDFDEDPFNGKIQIYVMGEPLPSPTVTLICAVGVIGILLYYKKKKQVTA